MKIRNAIPLIVTLFSIASTSYAGLNGDTVSVSRQIPSVGYIYNGAPFTFTAGPGDTVSLSGGNNLYLTVEDTSLSFLFGPNSGSGGPFAPNQHIIVFQDLSPKAPTIVGVSYETDLPGFVASDISFTANSVTVGQGGINYSGGQYLDVNLEFIPEPSSCSLFAVGIVGISWRKLISKRPW